MPLYGSDLHVLASEGTNRGLLCTLSVQPVELPLRLKQEPLFYVKYDIEELHLEKCKCDRNFPSGFDYCVYVY